MYVARSNFITLLDIARKFSSVADIKTFIKKSRQKGARQVILYFSDEFYRINSKRLSHQGDLSDEDLVNIGEYAVSLGVELIPCFNMPVHNTAYLSLVQTLDNEKYEDMMTPSKDMVNINKDNARQELAEQISEIAEMFRPYTSHFCIGMDEFPYSMAWSTENTEFANFMIKHINWLGLKTIIFNDGITEANYGQLNTNCEILYWKYLEGRATPDQLINAGFKVYNNHGYYLHTVPRNETDIVGDAIHAATDVGGKWQETDYFNGNYNDPSVSFTEKPYGLCYALWSELDFTGDTTELYKCSMDYVAGGIGLKAAGTSYSADLVTELPKCVVVGVVNDKDLWSREA